MAKSTKLANVALRLRPEDYRWFSASMRQDGRKIKCQWQMFQEMREALDRKNKERQAGKNAGP